MSTAMVPAKQAQANLRTLLEKARPSIQAVLPKHLDPDRLIKVALVATSKTPALLACSQESILQAMMTAAQLGLDAGGVLGSAYLVPFKGQCQLIIGYRGLVDLARRSGQIAGVEAHVVYQNDTFEVVFGLEPKLVHKPALSGEPGGVVAVYAIAWLKDGAKQVEVMTRAQVDRIRNSSRAGSNGPWVDHYDEMARKTVVKRLCKYLPLSPELAAAIEADNRAETGEVSGFSEIIDVGVGDAQPEEPGAVPQSIKDKAAGVAAKLQDTRQPGADDEDAP